MGHEGGSGRIRLHTDRYPGRAVFDTAVSHAMLRSVASGERRESLRLYTPDRALLFSSLDARRPGFARAVELARAAGFEPVIRLAGGRAAAFLEASMAFAWASADPEARLHIQPRFERLTAWIVAALRDLGLDARVGELPGEYCPGEYSVNIGGRVKVMGVGQRVIRGGSHVGGLVSVAQTPLLRDVLVPVYEAIGLDFRPETAGGVADFDASITPERVIEAVTAVLRRDGIELEATTFDETLHRRAEELVTFHTPDAARGTSGSLPAQGTKVVVLPDLDATRVDES